MVKNKLKNYEFLVLVSSKIDPASADRVIKDIESLLNKNGGTIVRTESRSRQRIAYNIASCSDAYQYFLEVSADPSSIESIRKNMNLTSEIIRFGIFALETNK